MLEQIGLANSVSNKGVSVRIGTVRYFTGSIGASVNASIVFVTLRAQNCRIEASPIRSEAAP